MQLTVWHLHRHLLLGNISIFHSPRFSPCPVWTLRSSNILSCKKNMRVHGHNCWWIQSDKWINFVHGGAWFDGESVHFANNPNILLVVRCIWENAKHFASLVERIKIPFWHSENTQFCLVCTHRIVGTLRMLLKNSQTQKDCHRHGPCRIQ